jgi:hypothetical protein
MLLSRQNADVNEFGNSDVLATRLFATNSEVDYINANELSRIQ